MRVGIEKQLQGGILDLGGGGEGIIGQIYGQQVIAIDNRQEELDEAPDGFHKLLMDATALKFADGSFDHVTSFFTLMYMSKAEQQQTIAEAARVLKPGGMLHIWDAVIQSAYPEPFVAELEIDAAGNIINTAYGIVKDEAAQDAALFAAMCEKAELMPVAAAAERDQFYLCFMKRG